MYFLHHAEENDIQPLNGAATVQQLLQCSFPPFWDAGGMEFALELYDELSAAVPCFQLDFKPDRSVIDYILTSDQKG
jgi:hypothetical protein